MSFHDTEMDVIRWAEATGQIAEQTTEKAHDKAVESVVTIAGLCDAILIGDKVEISEFMGRVAIDMIVLCAMLDIDLSKCLEQAFARVSAKPEKSNVVFLKQE